MEDAAFKLEVRLQLFALLLAPQSERFSGLLNAADSVLWR